MAQGHKDMGVVGLDGIEERGKKLSCVRVSKYEGVENGLGGGRKEDKQQANHLSKRSKNEPKRG